jgi:plexin A
MISLLKGWKRINTLKHYGVKNWAVMSLIMKQSNDSYISCSTKNSLSPIIPIINAKTPFFSTDIDNDRYWHLIKPSSESDNSSTKDSQLLHKAIPEIFLTRLLSTKGTVHKFVQDFFQTILSANNTLPGNIKYISD